MNVSAATRRVILSFAITMVASYASANSSEMTLQEDLVEQLKRLYGVSSEEYVVERLSAEAEASRASMIAADLLDETFAGSWFDAEGMNLVVAATERVHSEAIERLGAELIQVEFSLNQLRDFERNLSEELMGATDFDGAVHSIYIDYPGNEVVIKYAKGRLPLIRDLVDRLGNPSLSRYEVSPGRDVFVGGNVRAGDYYENADFTPLYGSTYFCSVGFSVVGGYLTAGHCGFAGDQVIGNDGTVQGVFSQSQVGGQDEDDRARVSTNQNWLPTPTINGYADGLLTVPSNWGALKEYVLYSTVCRYGTSSNNFNCGTIVESDVRIMNTQHAVTGQLYNIDGLKRTSACVNYGDSGGPFISPGDVQAQGTTITASDFSGCAGDPSLLPGATFEPIRDSLTALNAVMLTSHGANAPNVSDFTCPDMDSSGNGIYLCDFDFFNAQGQTGVQWSSTTGHGSQSPALIGTCTTNQWVSVDLDLTNVYGNVTYSAGFWCPSGPPQ